MEQYKKEKIFENSLAEFDDARYTILSPISADAHFLVGQPPKSCSRNIRHVKAQIIYHM
jgi:hypothetical protein